MEESLGAEAVEADNPDYGIAGLDPFARCCRQHMDDDAPERGQDSAAADRPLRGLKVGGLDLLRVTCDLELMFGLLDFHLGLVD